MPKFKKGDKVRDIKTGSLAIYCRRIFGDVVEVRDLSTQSMYLSADFDLVKIKEK